MLNEIYIDSIINFKINKIDSLILESLKNKKTYQINEKGDSIIFCSGNKNVYSLNTLINNFFDGKILKMLIIILKQNKKRLFIFSN